jgi:hypothetical protein
VDSGLALFTGDTLLVSSFTGTIYNNHTVTMRLFYLYSSSRHGILLLLPRLIDIDDISHILKEFEGVRIVVLLLSLHQIVHDVGGTLSLKVYV